MSMTSHDRVSRAWDDFNRAERTEVCLRFTDILRSSYPGAHVVRIKPTNCDLKGFAAAGFAEWSPDSPIDATRQFSAPGPRLDKDPGSLGDDVNFGRGTYVWQENKPLIVYEVEFTDDTIFGRSKQFFFLVGVDASVTDALLMECGRWTKELHDEVYVYDQSMWLKSKTLYKSVKSASWDDVVMDEKMKAKLIDDVQGFFDNQELYKSFGVPWKRGIILHGVPGNGKTISIKALINALSKRQPEAVPSLYVKNLDNCNGGPKHSIQQIFSHARSMAPCVLVFEDLDSMVTEKARSYFLNEVDGLESNDGILMIGSTNHLDRLDPAIAKRPSRFDRKYHFKVPNEHERTLYCEYWQQKMAKNPSVDFPEELCPILAKLTKDFSFAYLKELFVTSLLILARGNPQDHEEAIDTDTSGSSSTTDVVVVESPFQKENVAEKAVEDDKASSESNTASKDDKAKEVKKPKKFVPTVEVPGILKENVLLAIVRAQAQVLLDEMDNTEDGDTAAVKVSPVCANEDSCDDC